MTARLTYRGRVNLLASSWGAAAAVVQTELLRAVLASSAGGALGVGAVLGVWLAGIALGAAAGGWLSRRSDNSLPLAGLLALLAPIAALSGLFYLASIRGVAAIPPGELVPLTALALHGGAACLPFAFLVGAGFPVLARLASSRDIAGRDPAAMFIGGVWAGEAAGAFAGGVAFTFLLAGRSGPVLNVLLFSALPLAASWFLAGGRPLILRTAQFLGSILFAGLLVFSGQLTGIYDARCWQSSGAAGELRESAWSRYGYLALGTLSGQNTLYENGRPEASFPDPWSNAASAALLLSQHPGPRRMLVVGPAASGPAQALLAAGVKQVTSVHPDRELERLLTRNLPDEMLGPLRHGYEYVAADPRSWLRRPPPAGAGAGPAGWDMVWINLDGPLQMNSSRFYTPAFFRLARGAFGPAGGALALRFPSSANAPTPAQLDQAAAIISALKAEFPHIQLALSSTHCFVFAANRDSIVSGDSKLLMGRLSNYEGRVEGLNRYLLEDYYDSGRIEQFSRALEPLLGMVRPHSDSTPTAWFHYLRTWSRIAGASAARDGRMGLLESALEFAGRLNPVQAIAMFPLLVSILLLLAWLKARPETGIESALTVLTVAVAGFTAMEVTMSMIYLCQILFGALFYQVAMISSTFMLALAGGSWWSSRHAPTERVLSSGIANLLFALGAAALAPALIAQFAEILGSVPSTWTSVAVYAAFYTGLLLTGLLCGALFPWAAEAYHRSRRSTELGFTAACLDAADHVGASLAAVVAGSVMIPALGLKTTGLGAGLMVVCVALFWSALAVRR